MCLFNLFRILLYTEICLIFLSSIWYVNHIRWSTCHSDTDVDKVYINGVSGGWPVPENSRRVEDHVPTTSYLLFTLILLIIKYIIITLGKGRESLTAVVRYVCVLDRDGPRALKEVWRYLDTGFQWNFSVSVGGQSDCFYRPNLRSKKRIAEGQSL